MRMRIVVGLLAALLVPLAVLAELPQNVQQDLASAKYVYISSTRKDGTLSKPAEIWFMWHDGAVYVGTRPTSWRVKRIKAGRPEAKIAVGKVDGPSFDANGSLVTDAATQAVLMETFGKKYATDGWSTHGDNFRSGFKDGSRVVVKYVPK